MLRKIMYMLLITFSFILSSCGGSSGSGGGGGSTPPTPGGLTITLNTSSTIPATSPLIVLGTSLPVANIPTGSITMSSNGVSVPLNTSLVGSNAILVSIGSATLSGTTTLNVTSALISTTGVAATPFNQSFTISGSGGAVSLSVVPANLSTNVVLSSPIQIVTNFVSISNAPSALPSVSPAITITSASGASIVATCTTSAGIITCTPSGGLSSSTTYTVSVSGLTGTINGAAVSQSGTFTSTFSTGVKIMVFGTGLFSSNMITSGDGVNWNLNWMFNNNTQIMISGPNALLLGSRGSISSPLTSLFSSYQMQSFPGIIGSTIQQYASNGAGTIVGVGNAGNIAYSTNNGLTWSAIIVGAANWQSIAFGNNVFVVIDNGGLVSTSTNGSVWSTPTTGTFGTANTAPNIVFANGFFVVANGAASPVIYSSATGTGAWTAGSAITACGTSPFALVEIAYGTVAGTNYWVTGCGSTTGQGVLNYSIVSANAAPGTWTSAGAALVAQPIRAIAFGNSEFVIGFATTGQLAYSSGASGAPTVFTLVATTPLSATNINSIAFGGTNGTTFVAVGGNGQIGVSTTTVASWAPATVSIPAPLGSINLGAAYAGIGGVIYVGNNTFITGGTNSVAVSSTNGGTTWSTPSNPPAIPANAAASGNLLVGGVVTPTQIVVGNNGSIYYSTNNALTWTSATSGVLQNLNAIACGTISGSGVCVAVGNAGTVIYSSNGSTWTSASSGVGATQNLNNIIFGNGIFVAVGGVNGGAGGVITSSTNNLANPWSAVSIGTNAWNSVAFAMVNGTPTFVAAGGSGTPITGAGAGQLAYNNTSSTSGVGTWISASNVPAATSSYTAVAFGIINGTGQFLAVGGNGAAITIAYRSLDGVNWSASTAANPFGAVATVPTSIASSPTLWVVSSVTGGASTSVYTSADANNFTAATLPLAAQINNIAYVSSLNVFVAATLANSVLVSASPALTSSWNNYLAPQILSLSKVFLF